MKVLTEHDPEVCGYPLDASKGDALMHTVAALDSVAIAKMLAQSHTVDINQPRKHDGMT